MCLVCLCGCNMQMLSYIDKHTQTHNAETNAIVQHTHTHYLVRYEYACKNSDTRVFASASRHFVIRPCDTCRAACAADLESSAYIFYIRRICVPQMYSMYDSPQHLANTITRAMGTTKTHTGTHPYVMVYAIASCACACRCVCLR